MGMEEESEEVCISVPNVKHCEAAFSFSLRGIHCVGLWMKAISRQIEEASFFARNMIVQL